MKAFSRELILTGALFALAACGSQSSTMRAAQNLPVVQQAPPTPIPPDQKLPPDDTKAPEVKELKLQWITQDGGQRQFDFNPKTDILFVIDNSDSMKSAQENLSRNIDRFVADLRRNRMIDYHIGVVSVWDSSERAIKASKFAQGELRNVKNRDGQMGQARFITRAQSDDALLADTLKIGVLPYNQGGPEVEEIFSPLSASLEKTGHGDTNEGFFREEAPLVVVVVTDADDSTARLTPEQMADELFRFKGNRKDFVSAYGVLVRKTDSDEHKDWGLRIHPRYHPECFDQVAVKTKKGTRTEPKNNGKCTGFGPDRLEDFIVAANSQRLRPAEVREKMILGLNQDFGPGLARIGSDIAVRALEKEIILEQRPRLGDNGQLLVRVRYGLSADLAKGGGTVIPQGAKGWLYDPENNSVRLSGEIKYSYQPGARFAVDMVPVDFSNAEPVLKAPASSTQSK